MNFRQVHLDFHTSEKIPDVGTKFDKRQFQEALQEGCVDSITLFAKCHHGWSYFSSKINPRHPSLTFDLLDEQIKAAHEIGVKTPIYISAGLDEHTARAHPEWVIRREDESTTWCSRFSRPGYHRLCMNSPYLELLAQEVAEVCHRFEADGIFMDIVGVEPCYCQNCIRILEGEGKDPYDEKNLMELAERTYKKYHDTIRKAIVLGFFKKLLRVGFYLKEKRICRFFVINQLLNNLYLTDKFLNHRVRQMRNRAQHFLIFRDCIDKLC